MLTITSDMMPFLWRRCCKTKRIEEHGFQKKKPLYLATVNENVGAKNQDANHTVIAGVDVIRRNT